MAFAASHDEKKESGRVGFGSVNAFKCHHRPLPFCSNRQCFLRPSGIGAARSTLWSRGEDEAVIGKRERDGHFVFYFDFEPSLAADVGVFRAGGVQGLVGSQRYKHSYPEEEVHAMRMKHCADVERKSNRCCCFWCVCRFTTTTTCGPPRSPFHSQHHRQQAASPCHTLKQRAPPLSR